MTDPIYSSASNLHSPPSLFSYCPNNYFEINSHNTLLLNYFSIYYIEWIFAKYNHITITTSNEIEYYYSISFCDRFFKIHLQIMSWDSPASPKKHFVLAWKAWTNDLQIILPVVVPSYYMYISDRWIFSLFINQKTFHYCIYVSLQVILFSLRLWQVYVFDFDYESWE